MRPQGKRSGVEENRDPHAERDALAGGDGLPDGDPQVRLFFLVAALAIAQPKTENAKVQTRAVNGSLDASFRTLVSSQTDAAWIGYQVAQIPGERSMCGTVSLEGAKEFVVLYRVAAGQVEKIRTYASDCTFDAGDLPLYWLTGVDGSQSALLLASFIPPADTDHKGLPWQLANSALAAIARHQ